MFSPTARSIRSGMLEGILELEPPTEPQEDPLVISDPTTLSERDEAAFYELQDLEEQFGLYTSISSNMSSARFVLRAPEPSPSDQLSILASLSSTDPETQHILHKLRGLQSLLPMLRVIACSHPGLVSQRDDLITTIDVEIEQMIEGLWNERQYQLSASSSVPGIRRVVVDDRTVNSYTSPLVTSVIVLTAVIHTIMRVSRANCRFILSSLRAIVAMALKLQAQRSNEFLRQHLNDIPSTLPTALHRLNLAPTFDLYACCPECSRLYPYSVTDKSFPDYCTTHNLDGIECGATLTTTRRRGTRTWKKPLQTYSHMRFETWISELLLRPGIEDLLNATRPNPDPNPILADVWDAPYLKTFPNPAQQSFTDTPKDELHLVMMLHFDFFNPFQMKVAGKLRSVGCFFMICLNLPPDIRYNPSNAYLVSVIPGPFEPKLSQQPQFIGPIVNNMLELFAPGVWVSRTYKYPHGRRVQAGIAIESADVLAARGSGGFATHSHTCFCHLCNCTLDKIDNTTLQGFILRTLESHREQVNLWVNAKSLNDQKKIYDRYGVRYVDWLKLPWWNPFASTVIGPMHWTKNTLEKQLRINMAWSWTIPAGLPEDIPRVIQPVSVLEYEWGTCALLCLDEASFRNAKLTASLLHYLCRQRHIFEAGLSSARLISDLNAWRKMQSLIAPDGSRTDNAIKRRGDGKNITLTRAHYYVSRYPAASVSVVSQNSLLSDLKKLCVDLGLNSDGTKEDMIKTLQSYYAIYRVPNMPDIASPSKSTKSGVSLLGFEVLSEVKADMERTTLPSWLKHPPINFATVDHGKLQCEEMKSLAMVSFTITLVRLWSDDNNKDMSPLRQRMNHFLHLMLAVRILAFQAITEQDILAFESHYEAYLTGLKVLYPTCSRIPVQHLGLHIPQFLRALGPSTRYSESTCEQFIGMFQRITTNYKFGDLEQTLHREFAMASRLKGALESNGFTKQLEDFGDIVQEFLQQHIPSQDECTWKVSHGNYTSRLPDTVFQALESWANAWSAPPFPRDLYICSKISLGNVIYAPYTSSSGNACVLFSPPGRNSTLLPGRIDFILQEPATTSQPRIVLVVRAFQSLSAEDSLHDPYVNDPVIGKSGAGIAELYYDAVEAEAHLIEPRDLVSHIAVCPFVDPENIISKNSVVILSLDLKHTRYA